MGEEPAPPGSDLPAVSGTLPGPAPHAQQFPGQVTADGAPPTYPQQSYNFAQQALNVNFDMAQPQVPIRPGPYNMTALANALPPANYRQGPFNPAQLRYNPSSSTSNIVGQTQAMPQYSGQPPMGHVPNPSYYMQQQPQMSPFYGSPMSSAQQQPNVSSRPNMSYYGNQVMPSQQSHPSMAYYYAQMPQFAHQGQPPHQGMPGSYIPGASAQHDPRLGPSQHGDGPEGPPFSPTQQDLRQCKPHLKILGCTSADFVQLQRMDSRTLSVARLESPDKVVSSWGPHFAVRCVC